MIEVIVGRVGKEFGMRSGKPLIAVGRQAASTYSR